MYKILVLFFLLSDEGFKRYLMPRFLHISLLGLDGYFSENGLFHSLLRKKRGNLIYKEILAISLCVRLYENICLYYTRYPVVDYIKIYSQRKNVCRRVLLVWEFRRDLYLGFSASMCGSTVLWTSCHTVECQGCYITSTLSNIHVSWFSVHLAKWRSWRNLEHGERRNASVRLSIGSHHGTDHAGQ